MRVFSRHSSRRKPALNRLPSNTYQAPGCQQAMTSPDARPSGAALILGRVVPPSSPTFVSLFGFQALEPAPNTYRGSCSGPRSGSVSQKLVGSLTRPIKMALAPGPVGSRLEQGAELVGGAPFGAPRMCGGEAEFQSKRVAVGHRPGDHRVLRGLGRDHRSQDLSQVSSVGSALFRLELTPVGRRDTPPPLLLRLGEEALHVEDAILAQHEIDDAAELGGQDRQRLGLAVAPRDPS